MAKNGKTNTTQLADERRTKLNLVFAGEVSRFTLIIEPLSLFGFVYIIS